MKTTHSTPVRATLETSVAPAIGALCSRVGVGEVTVAASLAALLQHVRRHREVTLTQIRPAVQSSGTLKVTCVYSAASHLVGDGEIHDKSVKEKGTLLRSRVSKSLSPYISGG